METPFHAPTFRQFVRCAAIGLGAAMATICADAQEIQKGKVIPKVVCAEDATQSYALYIPSNYTATRAWPVVYCLDPGAHGQTPVERLAAAAEKYGFVIAGSNNSRNGPTAANVAALSAMVNDVSARYDLDPRRVYAAGLSGGARVASQVALSGFARGLIACSAGFAKSETPAKVGFAFFGTTGVDDFNYSELRRIDRDLDARNTAHRVVVFQGGHEWAPASVMMEALAWLELQAMRDGHRAKDEALIKEIWDARVAALPQQPVLDVYYAVKSLAADFKGLTNTAEYEAKARDLAASREVKDALKAEAGMDRKVDALFDELGELVADGTPDFIAKKAKDVRAKADAANDSIERRIARRGMGNFLSTSRDTVRYLFQPESRDYEKAAMILEVVIALRPERPDPHYDLARARAWLGNRKLAIGHLEKAIAAGFKDAERIRQEEAFAKLRNDANFQSLVASIK